MKFLIFFISLILLSESANTQNLIKDPSFESVYLFQEGKREYFAYQDWKSLSKIPMKSWSGAPDYSEYLSRSSEEYISKEYFKPYKGNSYLSSIYTIERNLYQGKLIIQIQKGKKYKLTVYYKFGGDIISTKIITDNLNRNMGVLFTKYDLSDSLSIRKLNDLEVTIPKLISINTYDHKKDNNKWKYFESEFIAEDDYDYIVIGSFGKLMDKSPFPPTVNYGVSWRFDELSLVEIHEGE